MPHDMVSLFPNQGSNLHLSTLYWKHRVLTAGLLSPWGHHYKSATSKPEINSVYVCVCVCARMHSRTHVCSVTSSCLTLCDPKDYSPPGSSIHGILQARILEWVAMPVLRGSSNPRFWTCASCMPFIAGRFFTAELLGKPEIASALIIQSEVSQKDKDHYSILTHIYGI